MHPSPSAETLRPPNSLCSMIPPSETVCSGFDDYTTFRLGRKPRVTRRRADELLSRRQFHENFYGKARAARLRTRVGDERVHLLRARLVAQARGRHTHA